MHVRVTALYRQEWLQVDDHDGDVIPAPSAPRHGDQLLARVRAAGHVHAAAAAGGGCGGDGVDRLLVGHLAPEAGGGEDEEAAVAGGGEAHARRLRLARHPLLHAGIAERARHGEAVLHAPHPAAAAAHVPALKCIAHTLIDRQQRRLSACLGA